MLGLQLLRHISTLLDIVRTYADNGKSGLRLDGRDAPKQLLFDVQGGSRRFRGVQGRSRL
jgi:hypothetical protein